MRGAKGRVQMTEDRRQRSEIIGQGLGKDGGRRSGSGGQTTEDTPVKYKTKGIYTLNVYNFSFLILGHDQNI